METFYRTHKYLVEHLTGDVHRVLMDQINWNERLITIKGTRGVGKTTFLLQYAKKYFGSDSKDCLYVNLNHFYFANHSIIDFAKSFIDLGGKVLLLDQIFKYPDWERELIYCYNEFPQLRIVFTVSTVMRFWGEDNILDELADVYNLRGFSFREFLNITLGESLRNYSIEEIAENHKTIAAEICEKINPLQHMWDYMHHGYYPFFLENKNFSENLLKNINMMLEIDVLSIRKIEHSYLPKLRKLLYLVAQDAPNKPNISKLSNECEISRATVTNYFEYLRSARLLNLLYTKGESFPKKPESVLMHNTNLIFLIQMTNEVDKSILRETFFYNQLHHSDVSIKKGKKKSIFIVENYDKKYKYNFKISGFKQNVVKKNNYLTLMDDIKEGSNGIIPLWLFGFLY